MIATGSVFFAGASTWWIAEYFIHRFVGHGRGGRSEFAREHRRHHAVGHYFAPTPKKVRAVAPVMAAVLLASSFVLGWWLGAVYTLGLAASYVGYEVFHRRIHTHAPRGPFGRWARRHHLYHHYVDPKTNHGVTMHLGDIVMRTLVPPPRPIRVPERLATAWLLDAATGELRREFAEDYVLVRLPSNR